jgi:hypothetical protein
MPTHAVRDAFFSTLRLAAPSRQAIATKQHRIVYTAG